MLRLTSPGVATREHRDAIGKILGQHNESKAGSGDPRLVAILLEDENDAILGGLWGNVYYEWLFVDLLAVAPEHRLAGYGAALVRRAEEIAIAENCVGIWVDTFEFQSPGLYEKLGFDVFGVLDDHPRGQRRIFMRKLLPPAMTE